MRSEPAYVAMVWRRAAFQFQGGSSWTWRVRRLGDAGEDIGESDLRVDIV